ncbi:hypothetical protein SKAU_G00387790 [Synaphobranchus kaupii]|uniref:Uncharacterized protein n=1 Tax=Synaphobranchus kaupii TaxID=118154 RepID=A0A9Q1EB08_SYNKA|nr:hypothetical protein SKAU_G00387790 [Synaphobranchus kaupii]
MPLKALLCCKCSWAVIGVEFQTTTVPSSFGRALLAPCNRAWRSEYRSNLINIVYGLLEPPDHAWISNLACRASGPGPWATRGFRDSEYRAVRCAKKLSRCTLMELWFQDMEWDKPTSSTGPLPPFTHHPNIHFQHDHFKGNKHWLVFTARRLQLREWLPM